MNGIPPDPELFYARALSEDLDRAVANVQMAIISAIELSDPGSVRALKAARTELELEQKRARARIRHLGLDRGPQTSFTD